MSGPLCYLHHWPQWQWKTTMLRLLNRLNEAEQGTILYNGEDIQKLNPMELRRRVVMLGQTPVIYPGDIEENLQIGLRLSGRLPATKQKLKEYLEKVDLHKELQESCERLSGGEKQRLWPGAGDADGCRGLSGG